MDDTQDKKACQAQDKKTSVFQSQASGGKEAQAHELIRAPTRDER
jgi:hypothetical protein